MDHRVIDPECLRGYTYMNDSRNAKRCSWGRKSCKLVLIYGAGYTKDMSVRWAKFMNTKIANM
eukprot:jgi/Botrbrau1/17231/Bobra.0764s0002.1